MYFNLFILYGGLFNPISSQGLKIIQYEKDESLIAKADSTTTTTSTMFTYSIPIFTPRTYSSTAKVIETATKISEVAIQTPTADCTSPIATTATSTMFTYSIPIFKPRTTSCTTITAEPTTTSTMFTYSIPIFKPRATGCTTIAAEPTTTTSTMFTYSIPIFTPRTHTTIKPTPLL